MVRGTTPLGGRGATARSFVGCDGPSRPVLLSRSPGRSSGGSPVMAGSTPVRQAYPLRPPPRLRVRRGPRLTPPVEEGAPFNTSHDRRHTVGRHTGRGRIRRAGEPTTRGRRR
ncbi:hypothetical protein C8054_31255 [Micromonospora sp. RP3T]|nr:hypothetical protein C8054_31255 [Micromonospora sp. RP3T]